MIDSTSTFIRSTIPLYHNAVKSIIFKCAELFMGIFVFKLFSLIAARSNQFTSYLMFTEDYIQRTLYITSRGLSRAGLVVLVFSIVNITLSLYGTLLWALDSPGYIFQASNGTITDYEDQRNTNPPYIIQLSLDSSTLQDTAQKLPQIIGADLFNPGFNYSLTGLVTNNKLPEAVTPPTEKGYGARIWLDDDGFSVSADTLAIIPPRLKVDGEVFSTACYLMVNGSAAWNCTFNNVFSEGIVATVTGKPEVHWDAETDRAGDTRYVLPNRADNIWLTFGAGGGSAVMNQIFSVTKKHRRHTFSQSTFKSTMLSSAGVMFDKDEVTDLLQRTWSFNETERKNPLIGRIANQMIGAQSRNLSYEYGGNAVSDDNRSLAQTNWGMYMVQSNGLAMYSLISITTTNITLIRSETIAKAPEPFQQCGISNFQNEAFGGKVTRTDCEASVASDGDFHFFGQVDTAAVMVAHGLGDGRSNISSKSLNNDVLTSLGENSDTLQNLLIARAYAGSIDASAVQITVDTLMVAMSYLQLALSCLALLLALVLWLGLLIFADAHWASSLMSVLINTTSEPNKAKPGYMMRTPDVTLQSGEQKKKSLAVDGMPVTLYHAVPPVPQGMASPAPYGEEGKSYMETGVYPVGYNDPTAGEQGTMAGYAPVYPNTR